MNNRKSTGAPRYLDFVALTRTSPDLNRQCHQQFHLESIGYCCAMIAAVLLSLKPRILVHVLTRDPPKHMFPIQSPVIVIILLCI